MVRFIQLSDFGTVVLYFFIVSSATLLMYLANKEKKSKRFLVLCYLILALPAAMRWCVGRDYELYLEWVDIFGNQYLWNLPLAIARHPSEPSFIILSFIFHSAPYCIFAIYAILTQYFFLRAIWYFRRDINPTIAIFIYTTLMYLRTYNIFRQMLAVAIVFFALRYIYEKKLIKYIMWVAIASLFHTTAIISIVLYVFLQPSKSMRLVTKVIAYSWPIFFVFLSDSTLSFLYNSIPGMAKYDGVYMLENESIFTIGSILQIFIFCYYLKRRKFIVVNEYTKTLLDKTAIMQLVFHFLSFKLGHAGRIGLYFTVPFILQMASLHGDSNRRIFDGSNYGRFRYCDLFIIVYGFYQFFSIVLGDRFGTMPYKFWY